MHYIHYNKYLFIKKMWTPIFNFIFFIFAFQPPFGWLESNVFFFCFAGAKWVKNGRTLVEKGCQIFGQKSNQFCFCTIDSLGFVFAISLLRSVFFFCGVWFDPRSGPPHWVGVARSPFQPAHTLKALRNTLGLPPSPGTLPSPRPTSGAPCNSSIARMSICSSKGQPEAPWGNQKVSRKIFFQNFSIQKEVRGFCSMYAYIMHIVC